MTVQIDKDTVTTALRERGDHDRAVQAECVLPRSVDTERDVQGQHRLVAAAEGRTGERAGQVTPEAVREALAAHPSLGRRPRSGRRETAR